MSNMKVQDLETAVRGPSAIRVSDTVGRSVDRLAEVATIFLHFLLRCHNDAFDTTSLHF